VFKQKVTKSYKKLFQIQENSFKSKKKTLPQNLHFVSQINKQKMQMNEKDYFFETSKKDLKRDGEQEKNIGSKRTYQIY
jgi:hypothetical protein